jgi:hypothetical protein
MALPEPVKRRLVLATRLLEQAPLQPIGLRRLGRPA